jgi:DNA-binding IclR family transcriptional regulator
MTPNTEQGSHLVPAVARAIQIFDFLAEKGHAVGSNEIARQTGLPKSSVANICIELEQAGLLTRREGGYALGRRLVELGGHYLGTVDGLREYYDLCASLPIISRESSRIAILDGTDVLYIGKYEGRQQIRLTANIGDRFPAICTATGKALLALLPPGEAEQRYKEKPQAFVALTENSLKNTDELSKDLEATRKRGYAIDNEEATLGVVCFGMAATGFRGDTSSLAVSATVIAQRLTPEFRQAVLTDLTALSRGLSNPLAPQV